jgi:hypothetical protein
MVPIIVFLTFSTSACMVDLLVDGFRARGVEAAARDQMTSGVTEDEK